MKIRNPSTRTTLTWLIFFALLTFGVVWAIAQRPQLVAQPATITPTLKPAVETPTVSAPPSALQTYHDPALQVSLQYPSTWQPDGEAAFRGPDGFFRLDHLPDKGTSFFQVCELEANTHPDFYGTAPELSLSPIQDNEACLILSSLNQTLTGHPAMVVAYPRGGQPGGYLRLAADPAHLESIAASLQFLPGAYPAAAPTKLPMSTQPAGGPPAAPVITPLGNLTLTEYAAVSDTIDTPGHIEFNQRLPEAAFDSQHNYWGAYPQNTLTDTNRLLAPFGYRLGTGAPSEGSGAVENSSQTFTLYQGDRPVTSTITMFWPPAVNQSGSDFAMVVQEENGAAWLVRQSSLEAWDMAGHFYATFPIFAGDSLATVEMGDPSSQVRVRLGDQVIFTMSTLMGPDMPVKSWQAWQGGWVLEVDGLLVVNGEIVNLSWGYDEIFNWQYLNGKPFFFFRKDGQVGISYDGQVLPVKYGEVVHYQCCEPAAFNVSGGPQQVWYYADKDGTWYYNVLGAP